MRYFKTLSPDWPLPQVHAYTFLAETLDGQPASFSFHTALGASCRELLESQISPAEPISWLKQVHGDTILEMPQAGRPEADASWTSRRRTVCVVQTADCLPVVFAHKDSRLVGVAHAGRRGIESGLLEKMVQQLGKTSELLAWIGPGIAAESYPVSREMRDHFLKLYPEWPCVFKEGAPGQFHMDIQHIARLQLERSGLPSEQISGGCWNTFNDLLFHSARRDGEQSGRMATVVWME